MILIGIPTGGTVKSKTLFSIMQLLKHATFEYDIIVKESCVIHWNREHICKEAVERGYSHVLFIDSDMFFEPDAVERLLKRDKDIIGVQVNLRQSPPVSTVKTEDEGQIIKQLYPDGLLKCAGVGTGFMLIKTSVFKNLSHPWFFWEADNEGNVLTGEDIFFCRKARKAGFEIWCDTTIKMGHVGDWVF